MPITTMPLAVASEATTLNDRVSAYLELARQKAAGGITVAEFGELVVGGLRLSIAAVDALAAPGADKKATVVEVAGTIFDQFADLMIPLALRPVWWIVRPAARALTTSLASGAVEVLLPMIRSKA